MPDDFTPLEDYGLVGNQETCALISRTGSVDWLPFPFLDSPSGLAAILDPERGGVFSVTPLLKFQSVQRYLPHANVLVTEFKVATGQVTVTDFMPPLEAGLPHRLLLRKIEATRRESTLLLCFRPRFDYGRLRAECRAQEGAVTASAEKFSLSLFAPALEVGDGEASATYVMREGDTIWLVLSWDSLPAAPQPEECDRLLERTLAFWSHWSELHERSESVHRELCHDLAMRSGLLLKLLINPRTGGIAAAASLALPESIGGIRNWDYRFAWLRDASFTAQALFHLGYPREAARYRTWVLGLLGKLKDLSGIRPCYPLHASAKTEEGPVEALCGYRHSSPVRVGNLASHQTQMDIYGELVNTVYETTRHGEEIEPEVWDTVRRICDFVVENWGRKDRGIWEMRTPPRDYVHSKLMCWVALDRGCAIAKATGRQAPVREWHATARKIHNAILKYGFSKTLNSFVQSFQDEALDASALLIPILGFLPPKDPRVQGTIDAIRRDLDAGNGLIYRYRADDGLAGREGAFILCSYWLVIALSISGRVAQAEAVFRRMLGHLTPLGLMSEECDPRDGRMIGNFPQALSHIGLINAALYLGIAKGHGHQHPPPQAS